MNKESLNLIFLKAELQKMIVCNLKQNANHILFFEGNKLMTTVTDINAQFYMELSLKIVDQVNIFTKYQFPNILVDFRRFGQCSQ